MKASAGRKVSDELKRCVEGSAVMMDPTAAARFCNALAIDWGLLQASLTYLLSEVDDLSGFAWGFLPEEYNTRCLLVACRQNNCGT